MSATGLIMGTPEYMSPEQVRGGTVDQRSDIYSLGAVVYQMLTGQPPFIAETPIAVGFLHCSETPRSLMEISSGIPQTVEDVVLKALAKEPSQRFDRAADFKAALRNA
jgi:serine/threonine-protein kinase